MKPVFANFIAIVDSTSVGNQKYNLKHIKEAINHAKDEEVRYAMLVYDSSEQDLPEVFGLLF